MSWYEQAMNPLGVWLSEKKKTFIALNRKTSSRQQTLRQPRVLSAVCSVQCARFGSQGNNRGNPACASAARSHEGVPTQAATRGGRPEGRSRYVFLEGGR